MKIPVLDQAVGVQVPNAPQIKAPSAVAGAFGPDVGAATEKIGNAGVTLADALQRHIYQENLWRGQAAIADRSLKLTTTFQDMATSTDPVGNISLGKAPSNTAPMESTPSMAADKSNQPKGYLNRLGFNATGSTDEFVAQAQPILTKYLEEFKSNPRLQKQAESKFKEVYAGYFTQVSKHEAAQYRLGMNNTFNSQTVNYMTQAAAANDVPTLATGIQMIKDATAQQYAYKGAEQLEIDNHAQKNVADAVSKAVSNKLSTTGDLAQAKLMLDSAKDSIPADRYEKIDAMLTTGFTRMQQQAHIATVQKTINGQANILTNLAGGKGNWMNIDDVAKLVQSGEVSEKFGKAYMDVIAQKGNYQPRTDENENVPKFIDAIYNAKDQTQLHDTLISVMQQNKNMGQDEMSILINSAMKRSGSLPLSIKLGTEAKADPKQLNIDAGARAVVNFGKRNGLTSGEISEMYTNYYKNASKGTAIPESIDTATKQYILSKYPAAAALEHVPTAVITPESKVTYLKFSPDVEVAPGRIFNQATGKFETNQNRTKSSGGKKQ